MPSPPAPRHAATKHYNTLVLSDDADQFLVTAIRRGDQRAWRQLIDRYRGRLVAFAARWLGGSDAEDALQETLLGFVTSLPRYDAARSLETYLFSILRHKIAEQLRRKQRTGPTVIGFDIDDDSEAVPQTTADQNPTGIAVRQ